MEESFVQAVYESLSGFLIPEAQVPGVENIFTAGQPAQEKLETIYKTYGKIRDRHHVNAVDEIEDIINAYEDICRIVGYKMYEYGAKFGVDGKKPAE